MNDTASPAYRMIEDLPALEEFARDLHHRRVIAVDLEADSMFHFREKVCLLQMATRETAVLIDTFKVTDLSSLRPVFARKSIKKIFHGADYDIRSLHRDFQIEVAGMFDTQLAARFLGVSETGLESVIRRYLNISLDKKFQRKDWSQRPLPPEMREYAAKDTTYLIPLTRMMEKELKNLNRLPWVQEECDILSSVRVPLEDSEPLFMRFKGAGTLRPRELAILEKLLQVRKEFAEKKDRPLFKVLGNEALLSLVHARPLTMEALKNNRALSPKQLNMYGSALISAVKSGLEIPSAELPFYPRSKSVYLPPEIPDRVHRLKIWRDRRERELNMDPALICNKALMTAIALKNPKSVKDLESLPEMRRWQVQAFGKEIVAIFKSSGR